MITLRALLFSTENELMIAIYDFQIYLNLFSRISLFPEKLQHLLVFTNWSLSGAWLKQVENAKSRQHVRRLAVFAASTKYFQMTRANFFPRVPRTVVCEDYRGTAL